VLNVAVMLLVTMPVKMAGFWATVIVLPPSLVTGPLTVVNPPENVMLPLLSSPVPPVAKMPKPLIWPKLLSGWPLLSNVPPVRLMTPALASKP
jgi:hypothetical protein